MIDVGLLGAGRWAGRGEQMRPFSSLTASIRRSFKLQERSTVHWQSSGRGWWHVPLNEGLERILRARINIMTTGCFGTMTHRHYYCGRERGV